MRHAFHRSAPVSLVRRFAHAAGLAVVLTLAGTAAGPACAQFEIQPPGAREPSRASDVARVRVTADVAAIAPGRTFHLALVFDLIPHWHVYWVDPGASGAATEISVKAPDGFRVGTPRFPRPVTFTDEEGVTYGYEGQAVIFVPVTPPATLPPGDVTFTVEVFYLVCRKVCLIGQARLPITLPAVTGGAPPPSAASGPDAKLLATFERRLPRPLDRLAGARAVLEGDHLVLTGPTEGRSAVALFLMESPGVGYGPAETIVADGRFRTRVPLEIKPGNARGKPMRVAGVIGLGMNPDEPCYSFMVPVPAPPEPVP